jgi:tRNA/tmRNA/rRNA uracil-C5-methylase (TrmA/RlmC/RlmD family)
VVELSPNSVAHLGEAVARLDGKAHFIAGAMPGEKVSGEVIVDKGSWARVRLTEVLEAAPERVEPPCRHFSECGGCQWQFADYPAQLRWKHEIVAGQLSHLGREERPDVRPTVAVGDPYGYRNRMDFKVIEGRPALHKSRSRELVPLDECLLLHPRLEELFSNLGNLGKARRLTLRVGATTDERLAIIEGPLPESAADWDASVAQRNRGGLRVVSGSGAIHEVVAGRNFRISGGSFFQNNTAGATALVDLVREALSPRPGESLLDAYAGGGLFGACTAPEAGRVIAVEASPTSVRDLRHNLRAAGVENARVARGRVEEVVPRLDEYWQIVVADPPRPGLGVGGVRAVTAAMPRAIAYVSCDPAGLARDTALLREAGYRLDWAAPVDLFPQTFHIETVAKYTAEGAD